jgi:hypothetical protein
MRSSDYEVALTLDAMMRLGELSGESRDELAAERDATLTRLGVTKLPEPPLPR